MLKGPKDLITLLRDKETTILQILGTEILVIWFKNDLFSNFKLMLINTSLVFRGTFLLISCLLKASHSNYTKKKKVSLNHVIIGSLQSYFMWHMPIQQGTKEPERFAFYAMIWWNFDLLRIHLKLIPGPWSRYFLLLN